MRYKDKAQELVQKHTKYAYVQRLKYVCASVPIEEARKQNAIEAALITAKECLAESLKSFDVVADARFAITSDWWREVITELEKMESNQ